MEPKKLRASHILLSHAEATWTTNKRANPLAEKEAYNVIQDIAEGLLSFHQAAKEHSACRVSAKNGGDLGWFDYPGEMEYPLAHAVSMMEKDTMLGVPIETEYGYHVILRTG